MAKRIEFGKFLIIECTATELYVASGGPGICDYCGKPAAIGYYIAVLNQWYCPKCFEEWKNSAHYCPEDADVEHRNFEFYAQRFGLICQ